LKKITKADFEKFKAEVERLIQLFGLKDWKIEIIQLKLPKQRFAQICHDYSYRIASFQLNTEISTENMMQFDPITSAKHEFGHLLLSEFNCAASQRFVRPDDIDNANEKLAVIFENIL
jgi:hypothetical protein